MPKVNWRGIVNLATAIVGAQVPAVARIEDDVALLLAKGEAKPSNQARLDAARRLVLNSLEAAEGLSNKDLLDDPEVARLVDGVSSAIVALMNGLAAKAPR